MQDEVIIIIKNLIGSNFCMCFCMNASTLLFNKSISFPREYVSWLLNHPMVFHINKIFLSFLCVSSLKFIIIYRNMI